MRWCYEKTRELRRSPPMVIPNWNTWICFRKSCPLYQRANTPGLGRARTQTYAVFHHGGHVSGVSETWKAIWNQGRSDAALVPADGPSFERYGPSFDGRRGMGGFEI